MARRRALSPTAEAEAKRLLGTGTSARAIARRFGVDTKVVTRLSMAVRAEVSAEADQVRASTPGDPVDLGDPFEAAQLRALELIKAQIEAGDSDARGLSQLVKAQNDTIKAIRAHRIMRGATDDGAEQVAAGAERVRARLERLQTARRPVVVVSEAVVDRPAEESSGTDG